jgi:hypothetical protein
METIDRIMELINNDRLNDKNGSFSIHTGNFIDDFVRSDDKARLKMIINEPKKYSKLSKKEYSYIAALVERLADYYEIDKPLWIYKKDKYYLDDPYFPVECKGRLRWFLLIDSPVQFKKRNIFVSKDHLIRV